MLLIGLAILASPQDPTPCPGDNWPGFRGIGSSCSLATGLPVEWSAEHNLAWTAPIPGYGQSSPVIWGDLVFVTSADGPGKEKCLVACHDLKTGALNWLRTEEASMTIPASGMVSRAAPTPIVDADRLYAFFESGDLLAFDHEGQLLWSRDLAGELGPFEGNHGIGGSPVGTQSHLFLLLDHAGPSHVICLDKATGEETWRQEREPRVSWSTPIVSEGELILSSNGVVQGLDLQTGETRWENVELTGNTVSSPTAFGEVVLVGSSDGGHNSLIQRGTGKILWHPSKARPTSFASPLVHGPNAYLLNKSGVLTCLTKADGTVLWEQRLADSCWASPVAADGRLYFFGKGGTTTVLAPGPDEAVVLAENTIENDSRVYGVAVVDQNIILREADRLVCLRLHKETATLGGDRQTWGQGSLLPRR